MTVFDDSFEHGFACLLEQHGESVSYQFLGTDTPVSRTAIVDRNPPTTVDQVGEIVSYSLMLIFHNNSTDGIQSHLVNNGGDKVYVSLKKNGTAEWRHVYSLVEGDGGVTQVAVR